MAITNVSQFMYQNCPWSAVQNELKAGQFQWSGHSPPWDYLRGWQCSCMLRTKLAIITCKYQTYVAVRRIYYLCYITCNKNQILAMKFQGWKFSRTHLIYIVQQNCISQKSIATLYGYMTLDYYYSCWSPPQTFMTHEMKNFMSCSTNGYILNTG